MLGLTSAAVVTLVFSLGASAKPTETRSEECADLAPGTSVHHRTLTVSSGDSKIQAYASVTLQRESADAKAKSCQVTYRFFVKQDSQAWRLVKRLVERNEVLVGATVVGFSPDNSKVAADFWWAAGDYTAVRPVIFDLSKGTVQMRELGMQIMSQLPRCDYFETFGTITDSGQAVIHVPKSQYEDVGCPDQGDWLFDLVRGTVRRIR
jgi:hypothetical protein